MQGRRWRESLPEDWRWLLTSRAAVWLALSVAVLSIATGLVNIGQEEVTGPLAAFIPDAVQLATGFTGAATGFLMLTSVLALRRELRVGWYATMGLLPVTALQGLLQGSIYSIPLVVLSLAAIPTLLVTRRRFDRSMSLTTTQLAAGLSIIAVQLYGTIGTFALREHYDGVETPLDAFYYTLVTASTVGYGDVTPQTQETRLFTMTIVVLGVASFGIAVGALLGPAIQARLTRTLGKMTDSRLELLDGHVLVLGYGDLTEPILDELIAEDVPFAVVTKDREAVSDLEGREIPVLTANPSDADPLRRAKIEQASAIVIATNHDAEDALSILTARQLRPSVPIVAAATNRENTEKLKHAGATTVLSPADLGGQLLARSALGEDSDEVLERILRGAGVD